MTNPNPLNDQDLIRQFLAEEEQARITQGLPPSPNHQTQTAPAKMTVKFGDTDFTFTKPEELQAEWERQQALLRSEFQTQRPNPGPNPNLVSVPVQTQTPALTPAPGVFNFEKYKAAFEDNPSRATDLALGHSLGLGDGVGASDAIKLLTEAVVKQQQELQNIRTETQQYQQMTQQTAMATEIQRFHSAHPEFVQDRANAALLNQIREQRGLPLTAQGLDTALMVARATGAPLKLHQTQSQDPGQGQYPAQNSGPYQTQYPQQTQTRTMSVGVPSIGSFGQPSAPTMGQEELISYLNTLSLEDAQRAASRFETSFKR